MKKTDIAMIVLIASLGVIIAYFIAVNISFLKLPEDGVKVQTVPELKSELEPINKDVFYKDAINPTVEVIVGGGGAD